MKKKKTICRISHIAKRNGAVVEFNQEKIANAIYLAILNTGKIVGEKGRKLATKLTKQVITILEVDCKNSVPNVEDIQDTVEKVLIENGQVETAKAYILYRYEHARRREQKQLQPVQPFATNLSTTSLKVLEARYLNKDENGNVIETADGLFRRVANYIAKGDTKYKKTKKEVQEVAERFYRLMSSCDFMPNSPTLMNAGKNKMQLSACYVIPVEDTISGIFDAIKHAAIVHKSGGGTGFAFSRLRPRNSMVMSTKGVASGPVSFMKIFNCATEQIKQGGTRRGANMGILRVDHPDVLEFIACKSEEGEIANFNISIAITDAFMRALAKDADYDLIDPHTKKNVGKLNSRQVWDTIITMAWKNGEPGVVFIDNINRDNPTIAVDGEMEATNPCGEQPLLPYEACNLGSINVANFVTEKGRYDWDRFATAIHDSVHFLDNVITMNHYPLKQIDKQVKANRKIGLGLMGFADMLFQLGIVYSSEAGKKMANKLMKFIDQEAKFASSMLAKERGVFPNFDKSIYKGRIKLRNATVTTIAPTGTISMIASTSSGVEPVFALSYVKHNILDGAEFVYVNKYFEEVAKKRGFYTEELMKKVAEQGTCQGIPEVPKDVQEVFVTARDITPRWHVTIQAAFQKYTDNAVSKTINFANSASVADVEEAYIQAHKLGCKGITIYRDGSRDVQILAVKAGAKDKRLMKKKVAKVSAPIHTTTSSAKPLASTKPLAKVAIPVAASNIKIKKNDNRDFSKPSKCPECKTAMEVKEGCATCPACAYSPCHVA